MTPKEKALELRDKYFEIIYDHMESSNLHVTYYVAEKCALSECQGILNILFQHHEIDYWKEVKKELTEL